MFFYLKFQCAQLLVTVIITTATSTINHIVLMDAAIVIKSDDLFLLLINSVKYTLAVVKILIKY